MPQQQDSVKPLFLNLDSSFETMQRDESSFIRDFQWDINGNANLPTGTGNPSGEGQNEMSLTPTRSNVQIPNSALPTGYNKCVGTFESKLTKELYYLNYNDGGQHGIYVISGDTLQITPVVIDPTLNFTLSQDGYFTDHRCTLRVRYDENKNIIEKYFIATNGNRWQLWINVLAAIATNGFNATAYPYYTLFAPQNDRRELLEYAVRPPMTDITAVTVANTGADTGKINNILDTGFEFCYQYVYTDGRESIVSPLSVPLIVQSESFLSNPDIIPKNALLSMYAGSCMVEKINLFYRFTKKQQDVNNFVTWSDWYLYDTIYKFDTNIPTQYWLRTNPWANANVNSYNGTTNILTYKFDNTKLGQITDQSLFAMVQSNMPILSVGMSDLGDAILLGNNQYGYDNIPESITNKISISVQEETSTSCPIPTRHIRLYAVAINPNNDGTRTTQVGFYNSKDTLGMRFGGLIPDGTIDLAQSALFDLYFGSTGENNAFVCYLKGTPYFSVGNWYVVSAAGIFTEITVPLDYSDTGLKTYLANIYAAGSYFVCVFDFEVPAGYYTATLGRHNISLSQDFRGQSTYTMGLCKAKANLLESDLTDNSKEFEVDCTGGDVDVWGNSTNSFLVLAPSTKSGEWCLNEGYIYDTRTTNNPFELLKAVGSKGDNYNTLYTDKNGFFFTLRYASSAAQDINVSGFFECGTYITFTILSRGASSGGYNKMGISYVSDYVPVSPDTTPYNVNVNALLYKVQVLDLTGTIPYSNIAVSIKDGSVAYTNQQGYATLVVHNASGNINRESSDGNYLSTNLVYINSGGNFLITLTACAYIAPQAFPTSACSTSQTILYYTPNPLLVNIIANQYTSLKQQGSYSVGIVLADLAGRVTAIQKVKDITVPSFLSRNSGVGDTNPTYFQWNIASSLQLNNFIQTQNAAWFGWFVTKTTNYKKYIQWVGDSITFYNAGGTIVTDTALASYVAISIDSLLETNIKNNFNLLASYQFQQNDRVRIYDDGAGTLFGTATYGSILDVVIQGTNYNQAAINAQLIAPPTNTVLSTSLPTNTSTVNIFCEYDSRFDKLQNKTGFWIELYTPSETNDIIPFFQVEGWTPIINGEIAVSYPATGNLNYWDTYLFSRTITIPNAGSKFFTHPFESPNITDTWGVNAASGGNPNTINPYAKQMFYLDDTIKSDDYVSQGLKNGLATFRDENRKVFKGYGRGGIMAIKTHYQLVFFLCENDWFMTDFNFNYVYANAQGVQIANLDNAMGTPHQKIGDNYGCAYVDTSSVIFNDKYALWHDKRNEGFIYCDFRQAKDITDIQSEGRSFGIKSYYCKKSLFVSTFNETHNVSNKIDVVTGIDLDLELIYVTFRPRRNNSKDINTFVNNRRNLQINYQETLVYSINSRRWLRLVGFTPESYGTLRGNTSGRIMVSFAQGIPYTHGNLQNSSYCNFFGVNVAPVISAIINVHPEATKTLQSISLDINNQPLWVDMIYSNLLNTFSYIPVNFVKNKEGQYYAAVQANMNSYPNPNTAGNDFRSMLLDGNKMRGVWFLVRFVADLANVVNGTNVYSELNNIYYKYTVTGNTNK